MSRLRVIRSANDTYRVPCRECGSHTEILHRQLPSEHRKFKVTCECGHDARVLLERRVDTRYPVKIGGYLFTLGTKEQCGDITIVELSISGMRFTSGLSEVQVGDQFTVGFFLDDQSAAWVEQNIEVRAVHDSHLIGAEFINPEQYSVDLDFYLMSVNESD